MPPDRLSSGGIRIGQRLRLGNRRTSGGVHRSRRLGRRELPALGVEQVLSGGARPSQRLCAARDGCRIVGPRGRREHHLRHPASRCRADGAGAAHHHRADGFGRVLVRREADDDKLVG